MIKETLRSSGANITMKHIEEVSMSALFLLESAKQVDHEFGVKARSTAHTIRDSASDVDKMRSLLTEKSITFENPERQSPPFTDYIQKGFTLLCKPGWIEGILQEEEEESDRHVDSNELSFQSMNLQITFS